MPPTKEDVRYWIAQVGRQIEGQAGQADLLRRLREIKADFERLLSEPFINERRFMELCGQAYGVMIDGQAREFDLARKKRSDRVVFDNNDSVMVISEKSRRSGESDLMHERDTQRLEEAYLFIRYTDRSGVTRSHWVEVGNAERPEAASIRPFQIAGILHRYSQSGRIIEASLYHYHPDSPPGSPRTSSISIRDLMSASTISDILGTRVRASLDFRVINDEGIYTFSGATRERLLAISQMDLYRINLLSGRQLVGLLGRYGIQCDFQPRSETRAADRKGMRPG